MADKNLSELEQRILKWDDPNDDSDTCDLLHAFFSKSAAKFEEWPDVAHEGTRLYGLMFDEAVEFGSPIDGLIAAVAAAGYELAISQVAKQLGVSCFAVRCALETDRADDAEAFVRECKQTHQQPEAHS